VGGQAKETAQLLFLCAPVLFIYGLTFSELGCLPTLNPKPQTLNPKPSTLNARSRVKKNAGLV
jgi:hypothetical protein